VGFEFFTAVMFPVEVFCIVMSCSVVVGHQHFEGSCCLHLKCEVTEDGGSMVLRNTSILPQSYTASQRRRPGLKRTLIFHFHHYISVARSVQWFSYLFHITAMCLERWFSWTWNW
jgi:hypothetical protein